MEKWSSNRMWWQVRLYMCNLLSVTKIPTQSDWPWCWSRQISQKVTSPYTIYSIIPTTKIRLLCCNLQSSLFIWGLHSAILTNLWNAGNRYQGCYPEPLRLVIRNMNRIPFIMKLTDINQKIDNDLRPSYKVQCISKSLLVK